MHNKTMRNYTTKEAECQRTFSNIGTCYHLWTPENFEIIFRNDSDFHAGMGIIAIASKCFSDITVITFELMTNHLHIVAAGEEFRIREMFKYIKKCLKRLAEGSGRLINWDLFIPGIRQLDTLADVRNVLIYDNRNGYLVHDNFTPFSYPWGANGCYFNPDAKKRYAESSVFSTIKNRRAVSHSHISDEIQGLKMLDGYFSPFSFCNIEIGEKLFRDAAQYFYLLGRNIEQNKEIAKEIGESISYADDELYGAISVKCRSEYGIASPSQIPAEAKIRIAKLMHIDYHASLKQIQRILRLEASVLQSIFGSNG